MGLDFGEHTSQRVVEFIQRQKGTVMGAVLAGVLPEALGGIKLWRVGRQRHPLQPVSIITKPGPDHVIFVIRGVVLNQNGALSSVVGGHLFLKERQVCLCIEHLIASIQEAAMMEFDRAENFDALALSRNGHIGRMTHPAPCRVQRRILSKTRFVGKNQCPLFALGFFFKRG
jgi:hypothetical protein